jgi:hypothetical protein
VKGKRRGKGILGEKGEEWGRRDGRELPGRERWVGVRGWGTSYIRPMQLSMGSYETWNGHVASNYLHVYKYFFLHEMTTSCNQDAVSLAVIRIIYLPRNQDVISLLVTRMIFLFP